VVLATLSFAQTSGQLNGQGLYDALKAFELKGKVTVSNLALKRDRGEMTFTGDFYLPPVNGGSPGHLADRNIRRAFSKRKYGAVINTTLPN
jgi:hypothetical protein